MIYYDRIDVSSIPLMLTKQVHQKSAIFVIIGISEIIVLSFNKMSA